MLDQDIRDGLRHFTTDKSRKLSIALGAIKVEKAQIETFNQEIDSEIRLAFSNIMSRGDIDSLRSLLDLLSELADRNLISKSVMINMLDDVLECVGVADLKQVLDVIRDRVGNFGKLEQRDENRLLRIINTLLKRISKTEDFHMRGELQMSLTKILTLCHDSGFHNRAPLPKIEELDQHKNTFFEDYKDPVFTIEFFEEFWELQRYFTNISSLIAVDFNNLEHTDIKLLSVRLNRIYAILTQTIKHFRTLPLTSQANNIDNFPLKFMKLPNLLLLQFNSPQFRAVIMIQFILFCHNLKNLPAKNNFHILVGDKQVVTKIEQAAEQELKNLQGSLNLKDLHQFLDRFFKNQQNWIQLKDAWKEKKKTLFKESAYEVRELKRKMYNPDAEPEPAPPEEPSVTAPINLKEKLQKYHKETIKKIGVEGDRMKAFLGHVEPPNLKNEPTFPSFSYFFSQAQSCLDSFDFQRDGQVEFDSRAEYNLFEWKTLRSLYRENLQDFTPTIQKNGNFKDYKLLSLLRKRENDFYDEPRKRVKPNVENPDE